MSLLLEIQNLTISFPNSIESALNKLSFSIETGDTLGIVGESGSGKSITGLAIMGLLPKDTKISGQILVSSNWLPNVSAKTNPADKESGINFINTLNHDFEIMPLIRGNKIAMIFQEPMTSLNPTMTCGRQVEESLILHSNLNKRERKAKIISLFEEVQLPNAEVVAGKYPFQLSGGQRQRVMIAMALACNPELLIADEPTTALDVTIQKEILELLNQLKKSRNLSMIFISHDLNVIEKISDKILVLKRGNLIEYGLTSEIINHPKQIYTKGLITCRPKPGIRLIRLPIVEDFETRDDAESALMVSDESRQRAHNQMYNDNPMLEIRNLGSWYPSSNNNFFKSKNRQEVLQNITLNVWKGETLGIVGESGSGKTTLGRVIMNLIKTYSGDIFYRGEPINNFKKSERKKFCQRVQLIFQDPYSSLNPFQTIGQSIIEPMIVHRFYKSKAECIEKMHQLMNMTRIDEQWVNRYPHQLSGGQRQRVVIARALALEPELIICDESVSALDVSIQAQILNLLNDLKDNLKLTYLFISHDLSVVQYISDRILVLKSGQVVELNEADELCSHPKNEYTKKLLESAYLI
jgi:peptide/nickel transport system ATP-binding protein